MWDQDNVAAGALVPIQRIVAPGNSPNMIFSNIPQTFRDLKLIVNGRSQWPTFTTYSVYVNGVGSTGWSQTYFTLIDATASAAKTTQSGPTYGLALVTGHAATTAGIFSSSEVDIFNYSATNTFKSAIGRNSLEEGTTGRIEYHLGTWANNAAITSVEVSTNGNWVGGSTATLYGIKAGL
jgi:hypothetical protein